MSELIVFRPGTEVKVGKDIPAKIIAVWIDGDAEGMTVRYKASWWNGRGRQEEWLASFEVQGPSTIETACSIGFAS